jgi:hypothetical protein
MPDTGRLFNCARCGRQVVICSCCDRGHRYCKGCAPAARQESRCAAGKRYQHSRRGRLAHAQRQRRYRARRQKVTHQGSPAPPPAAVLVPESRASAPPGEPTGTPVVEGLRCHFCGQVCGAFVRQDSCASAVMGHPYNSHPRGGREAPEYGLGWP